MNRPKLWIPKEPIDLFVERVGWAAIAGMVLLTIWSYGDLPETIPIHFGLDGHPDGYGPKWILWLLMGLGIGAHLLLYAKMASPHRLRYRVKITEENAERQYRFAVRQLRIVNAINAFVFYYLVKGIIYTAKGYWDGLGPLFIWAILVTYFGTVWFFRYQSLKYH